MRKIKLYIIASNDGFISPLDNDMEWLVNYPIPSKEDHELFLQSIDSVILGGNTYKELCCMDIVWPYKNKEVYVVTRYPLTEREHVNFISENVIEALSNLKNSKGKDIWLVGGATLVSSLLNKGLIDELIVTYIPIDLEQGTPLFEKESTDNWTIKEEVYYDNGALKRTYVSEK